jgi:hypothetical protein
MDIVWQECCGTKKTIDNDKLTAKALKAFSACFEEKGGLDLREGETQEEYDKDPRTLMTAVEMLWHYIDRRKKELAHFKLLAFEQPFVVPLDPNNPNLFYVGKIDKEIENQRDGRIYFPEHKTSSSYRKPNSFQRSFTDSFSPNSQIDGYLYAGRMKYGRQFKAIWIDAALVHKEIHDVFTWLPVERMTAQLDAWLWETHSWIAAMQVHAEETPDTKAPYMAAFPKNTGSCTNFGGCAYLDCCKMLANPSNRADPPNGFKIEKWDPIKELKLTKEFK